MQTTTTTGKLILVLIIGFTCSCKGRRWSKGLVRGVGEWVKISNIPRKVLGLHRKCLFRFLHYQDHRPQSPLIWVCKKVNELKWGLMVTWLAGGRKAESPHVPYRVPLAYRNKLNVSGDLDPVQTKTDQFLLKVYKVSQVAHSLTHGSRFASTILHPWPNPCSLVFPFPIFRPSRLSDRRSLPFTKKKQRTSRDSCRSRTM